MATLMSGLAESGSTKAKFVRRRRSDGAWWNTSGTPAFEAYNATNIASYGIAGTETGATGVYTATDPADTTAGDYLLVIAAATSLAVGDLPSGIRWQDSAGPGGLSAAEVTAAVPTVGAIADQVWDEVLAGHATTGSAGAALTASVSVLDPLLNTVPGSYASGTAGAALGRIGTAAITTTSPVAQSGTVTIVKGDDYKAVDGRALEWTGASANIWPDLTGATIHFQYADGTLIVVGSVVTPTGTQKVRAEPTAADTGPLAETSRGVAAADAKYDVRATLSNGDKVTLVRGVIVVLPTQAGS